MGDKFLQEWPFSPAWKRQLQESAAIKEEMQISMDPPVWASD